MNETYMFMCIDSIDVCDTKSISWSCHNSFSAFQVEFQICESRKNNTKNAVNLRIVTRNNTTPRDKTVIRNHVNKQLGFIATLKDSFGFIEMADHEKEVFFHFR